MREIEDIYLKVRELLSMGYIYAPASLASEFDRIYKASDAYKGLSDSKRAEHDRSVAVVSSLLDLCRDLSYYVTSTFNALKDVDSELDKDKLKDLFGLLTFLVDAMTEKVVNGWLVKIARDMGGIPASAFDYYNEFKEKWNALLNELEIRARRLGVEVSIKERAKELGVIAR